MLKTLHRGSSSSGSGSSGSGSGSSSELIIETKIDLLTLMSTQWRI